MAGREILKEDPKAKILYLTTFSDSEYIIEALKMGARGYLIKQEIDSIPPALQAVMSGQSVLAVRSSIGFLPCCHRREQTATEMEHKGKSGHSCLQGIRRQLIHPWQKAGGLRTRSLRSSPWWRKGSTTGRSPGISAWEKARSAITSALFWRN